MSSDQSNTPSTDSPDPAKPSSTSEKRVIKIGSQRPGHEIVPPSREVSVEIPELPSLPDSPSKSPGAAGVGGGTSSNPARQELRSGAASRQLPREQPADSGSLPPSSEAVDLSASHPSPPPELAKPTLPPKKTYPAPRRNNVPQDLQKEIDDALGGLSLDDLMLGNSAAEQSIKEPEIDQRYRVPVVKIHRDDVFFELNGHFEGVASVRQFDELPEIGTVLEVVVNKFNSEEGLYEVSVPGASMQVQDWSDLDEGVTVEALVTGHNSGGLECEVNKIRGFIPLSQISTYRVENIEEFVGEKLVCVVTEANPARGNLVLSRRAALEREQAASKEKLMASLAEGQTHEGTVRKLMDFGAFVDIGGADGLIHISRLSWDRVKHPRDVVEEGQKVKVKIEKFDPVTGKIGLSLRDTVAHPWEAAKTKYVENTVVNGVVSKIMEFGAFVRLEAGVEGLIHISELAHHRVVRVANVVKEGDEVTIKILSIDPESQRMSLSMKAVQAAPAVESSANLPETDEVDEPARESAVKKYAGQLRGGTNKRTGGEEFGLKW